MADVRVDLVVLYCSDLAACRDFYRGLGLVFERERHGGGPEHYAAALGGGIVLELYPAGSGAATGRIRLGLTVRRDDLPGPGLEPGGHVLRDPEGRAVDLQVLPAGPAGERPTGG
jgi:catechol 2,3-dioxygenase-like lactoylglutathione lyase family enzyme